MKGLALALLSSLLLVACGDDEPAPANMSEEEVDAGGDIATEDIPQEPVFPDEDMFDLGDPNAPDRPETWEEESHSDDAAPDYEKVFPQDRVNQLELRCSDEIWDAMVDDLADLTGADTHHVPDRPRAIGAAEEPPQEWFDACEGLADQDACEVMGGSGVCMDSEEFGLLCVPDEGSGGGLPEGAFTSCEELEEESACTASFYNNEEGVCLQTRTGLACIPLSWFVDEDTLLYQAAPFWDRKPIWVDCDIGFEGQTWKHVGVRFKGHSSLAISAGQTLKLPLRFDFDEFEDRHPEVDDQRFFGFKQLSTSNNLTDGSFLRQKMASDLFRAAGVPTPHTAYYRIDLKTETKTIYMGLYTVTEVPQKPMLKTQFEDDDGTLYKCDGEGARLETFHTESFHRKTNKGGDYQEIWDFMEALHDYLPFHEWRAALEETFDVEIFLRFLSLNQAMVNWDTYGAYPHNYYLYSDPARGKLVWIPWDFDLSMTGTSDLSLEGFGHRWPLIDRISRDPVYMARYKELMAQHLNGVLSKPAIEDEIARLHALIAPHVVGPEGEMLRFTALPSEDALEVETQTLQQHFEGRQDIVRGFLAP